MAYTGGESGVGIPIATGGQQTPFGGKQGNGASSETINLKQKIGVTETSLYTSSTTAAKGVLFAPKSVSISNSGGAPAGVVMKLNHWSNDTTNETNSIYLQFIVGKGETINIPMSRIIAADNVATFMDGTALAQAAPIPNMYRDSGALTTEGFADDADTTITFDDGSSGAANNLFRVGDLIRLDDEICKVREIVDTDADGNYTPANFVVDRGAHGSTKADHTNNTAIRLAFFNAYHNFTAATGGYDKVQTDNDGKFKATNFFGYGRGLTQQTTGILPGSVAIKCYNPGYQEWGMSGVTPGTKTGLTASTTYKFNITVDGGSTFADLSFTTDASNGNFGGRNGLLSKIQEALDTQYYTSGHLFEKKVTVGFVNGDVRFTSGTRLSTSAILLAAPSTGTTPFGVGRIPAIGLIETAIAARLPDNTLPASSSAQSVSNINAFMYDDGRGNLIGKGTGTIDYETGAIDFRSYPNTEFVVSARYGNCMSGAVSEEQSNTIEDISARSLNDNIETTISLRVSGYNLNV